MGWGIKLTALLALLLPAAAAAAAAPAAQRAFITAQDHGGNRIEPFRQIGQFGPPEDLRNCTDDASWCAWLRPDATRTNWTLVVIARPDEQNPAERQWRYPVPAEYEGGPDGRHVAGIWEEIIREAFGGGALIGLELWKTTGERPGFFSNQRRLLLLRLPRESGGMPRLVLEAPLSGIIEQPVCPYPGPEYWQIGACQDDFSFSTLFTIVPSTEPIVPPGLIMVATAETDPGHRTRVNGPVSRQPIERTIDSRVRDPVCTYTRTFYFDAARGRYVPDAPLPACRDYLEP